MKQQLLSLQPIVKAGMAFIGGGHSGAASSTVTRFVLNEYYEARSTKPEGHSPKTAAQSPKSEALSQEP